MNCNNCKNNNTLKEIKIKHVYGNVLRLAIPLTLRTIELVDGEINATDTPFIPSSEHPVKVVLTKGAVAIALDATMKDGNIAYVEEKGKIPVGTYAITVTCSDDNGNPYRFKQNAVLFVADATIEAGIEETIEYEVTTWYLDAAIYLALKGEDGVGIADIETQSSSEIGGTNTVTFILTDGRTRSFNILNGSGAVDSDLDITSPSPISNSAVTAKFNEVSEELAELFGDVDYDSQSKTIRFWDKGKANVLASLDARPFIKDGMVSNVYISNNTLVITFNTDSGREAIGVPLTSVFNPNNYYTKTQVDSRIASAVANINLTNYYTKSQVDNKLIGLMAKEDFVYEGSFNLKYGSAPEIVLSHIEGVSIYQEQHSRLFGISDGRIKGYVGAIGSQLFDYGVAPNGLVFLDKTSGLFYRWNGTTWQQVGGGGYEPPVGGIPKTDLASGVQSSLDAADSAYQKPSGGIPSTDMTSAVQTSLGKADTAYQKPSSGIPATDLASAVQTSLGKADTALQSHQSLADVFAIVDYDSTTKHINFYGKGDTNKTTIIGYVDATAFIKDGMVSNVEITNGNLVVTFNTDSGKEPISIALTNIFNPSNYYTKTDIDNKGYLTTETDPSVPAWAKAQNKPSYTASEVGAVPTNRKVNNKSLSDDITLTASDVGAVSSTGFVATDNNYTTSEKEKLAGIAEGAEVNVQADWNETNTSSDAYIANKPTIPAAQVQTDWNASSGMGVILNKPNLASVATSGSYNDLQDKPTIPAAYDDTTLAGRVTTLENAGYITTETDPTVPSWAKAESKPTYTAQEVGALPASTTIPSKTSDLTNDSGFLNKVFYKGSCSTSASAMPKVCTVETFPTTTSGNVTHAKDYTIIAVTFSVSDTNTENAPTLNVNTIGAKGIYYTNALVTSTAKNTTVAGTKNNTHYYYYDSSLDSGNGAWVYMFKAPDLNTTYSAMTQEEVDAGTSTTGRIISPKMLRDNFYTEGEVDTLLGAKASTSSLATVATSGDYDDLTNKPTIPAAQVQSDWNASSGMGEILNKPTLATVATSGSYNDLSNTPTIPTVPTNVSSFTNDAGYTTNTGTLTGVTFNGTSATVSSGVAAITATIPTVGSIAENSTDAAQSGAVYTALAGKQATLVKGTNLDAIPTNGSDNPVTSDGVYDALAGKQATLTGSDTLATINGTALYYGGSVTIQGDKGDKGDTGNVQVDGNGNVLIYNGLDKTTTGAALDASQGQYIGKMLNAKDSNFYKVWVGTSAELEALDGDYEDNTIYLVGAVATIPTKYDVTKTGISEHITVSGTNASSVQAIEGKAFTITLSPASGYTIDTVTVTMNSTDVTSSAYNSSTGVISIASVTGAIVITATASIHISSITIAAASQDGNNIALTATVSPANAENVTLAWSLPSGTTKFAISGSGANATLTLLSGATTSDSVVVTCTDTNASSGTASGTLTVTPTSDFDDSVPITEITDISATRTAANTMTLSYTADGNTPSPTFSIVGTAPKVKQLDRTASPMVLNDVDNVTINGNTLTYKEDCQVQIKATSGNAEYTKTITITHDNTDAIWFEDEVTLAALNTNGVGSNGAVTYAQAAAVTTLTSLSGNTDIVRFNEFKHFTSITTISMGATGNIARFNGCTNLEALEIPSSVTTISGTGETNAPFKGVPLSGKLVLPSTVSYVGNYSFGGSLFAELEMNPSSVTANFWRGSSLTKIKIGNKPTSLPSGAFFLDSAGYTTLQEVDLGSGISALPYRCFRKATGLVKLTMRYAGKVSLSAGQAFYGISSSKIDLYVPAANVQDYPATPSNYDAAIKSINAITE